MMQFSWYLLLSTTWGTASWLLAIKVAQLIRKALGVDSSRWWTPVSHAFLPSLAFLLVIVGFFLFPLLFKGNIKDWGAFSKVWSLGFCLGGFALARIIWGWGKPMF